MLENIIMATSKIGKPLNYMMRMNGMKKRGIIVLISSHPHPHFYL